MKEEDAKEKDNSTHAKCLNYSRKKSWAALGATNILRRLPTESYD